MDQYSLARDEILTGRQPATTDDLAGMAMDLRYGLETYDLRVVRCTLRADMPECMMEVEVVPDVRSGDLFALLEEAWLEEVAFNLEAHHRRDAPDGPVLEFVTAPDDGSIYFTGRIAIIERDRE